MSKMYTSEQVSKIVQTRVNRMNEKMNEIKKENKYLKEMIIDAFKEQYTNGN